MSRSEALDASSGSPALARSLFTVRAAISSALLSERPAPRSLSLTCSYIRAHFVPFLTPPGGIATSFRSSHRPVTRRAATESSADRLEQPRLRDLGLAGFARPPAPPPLELVATAVAWIP